MKGTFALASALYRMLAPGGYTPVEVDQMEIWQAAVLVRADHPKKRSAATGGGRDAMIAEAMARASRKAASTPDSGESARQPAPQQGNVAFGMLGPVKQ